MALKSMPLNQTIKNQALHEFYVAATKEAKETILKMERELAWLIYYLIYSQYRTKMASLPETLFEQHDDIPIESVVYRPKKRARKKGKIEPSEHTTYRWTRFSPPQSASNCWPTRTVSKLSLGDRQFALQAPSQHIKRYGNHYIQDLLGKGLISKTTFNKIEAEYIKACKAGAAIMDPIVEAINGVAVILNTCKTTKGLRDAWPEVEEFINLPQQSAGPLMSVDIKELTANLHKMGVKRLAKTNVE